MLIVYFISIKYYKLIFVKKSVLNKRNSNYKKFGIVEFKISDVNKIYTRLRTG